MAPAGGTKRGFSEPLDQRTSSAIETCGTTDAAESSQNGPPRRAMAMPRRLSSPSLLWRRLIGPLGPARQDKMKRRFVSATPSACAHFSPCRTDGVPPHARVSLLAASTNAPLICSARAVVSRLTGPEIEQRPDQGIADAEDGHGESRGMRIGHAGRKERQFVVRPGRSSLIPPQRLRDGGLVHRTGIARLHGHPDPIGALHPKRHSLSSPLRT